MTRARTPATKASRTTKKRCSNRKCPIGMQRLEDFHVAKGRKDGRQPWCRHCMNAVMRRLMRAKAAELRAFRLMKAMLDVAIEETSDR